MKMSLQDALSNWLSIQLVVELRTDDEAAKETADWFLEVLLEDHQVTSPSYQYDKETERYQVLFTQEGTQKSKEYPSDYAEVILRQIKENPEQFKNYHEVSTEL